MENLGATFLVMILKFLVMKDSLLGPDRFPLVYQGTKKLYPLRFNVGAPLSIRKVYADRFLRASYKNDGKIIKDRDRSVYFSQTRDVHRLDISDQMVIEDRTQPALNRMWIESIGYDYERLFPCFYVAYMTNNRFKDGISYKADHDVVTENIIKLLELRDRPDRLTAVMNNYYDIASEAIIECIPLLRYCVRYKSSRHTLYSSMTLNFLSFFVRIFAQQEHELLMAQNDDPSEDLVGDQEIVLETNPLIVDFLTRAHIIKGRPTGKYGRSVRAPFTSTHKLSGPRIEGATTIHYNPRSKRSLKDSLSL